MPARHASVLSILVALALFAAGAPAAGSSPAAPWQRPVDGPVAHPFDPPASRYGPGHLGVDLAAPPGTRVRAAGPGTVTFAGEVAGSLHVVVAHAGDLRTSYSFLASAAVRRGDRVRAGDVVGSTGGGAGPHAAALHFGLRAGEEYADPMALFAPVDLASVVHLAPVADPLFRTPAQERRGVLAGIGRALGAAGRVAEGAVSVARGAASAVASAAGAAGSAAWRVVRGQPLVRRLGIPVMAAASMLDWARERGRCADAPPADGTGGSGHRVMVVAGLGSETDASGRTVDLPLDRLGYEPGEVTYFSYSGRPSYRPADTHRPLGEAVQRLAAQLRALQRREPGREVDLVAHSQGGAVVVAFLTQLYDPGDARYPPLGTVVTLSSPLAGAPLATAAQQARATLPGWLVLRGVRAADRIVDAGVDPDAPALRDLAEGSAFAEAVAGDPLPAHVDLTTVGATLDWVVPAGTATRRGARDHAIVHVRGLRVHSSAPGDPEVLRTVRAALEGSPLPCRSFADAVRAAVLPALVAEVEHTAGDLLGGRPVSA